MCKNVQEGKTFAKLKNAKNRGIIEQIPPEEDVRMGR